MVYRSSDNAREIIVTRLRIGGLLMSFVGLMEAHCYFNEQIVADVTWVLICLFSTPVKCIDELFSEELMLALLRQVESQNPAVLDNVS
jgi:hypothetical protein